MTTGNVKPDLNWDERKKEIYPNGYKISKPLAGLFEQRSAARSPEVIFSKDICRPRHTAGDMNKLEMRYAEHLELRKLAGEILDWKFEPLNLCLAKATYLKIDFLLLFPENVVELHETKGHWEDDARAKVKIAAQMFPWWTIYGVKWDKEKKDWKFERIGRRGENNGRQ